MRSTLVTDTSVVYAAAVRRDAAHSACAELLAHEACVVPAPVVVEIDWLSHSRGVAEVSSSLLRSVEDGSTHVVDLTRRDYGRVSALLEEYASLGLSLVDASVVAIAERLEEDTIATLDRRHFSIVRPQHVETFTLVPSLD